MKQNPDAQKLNFRSYYLTGNVFNIRGMDNPLYPYDSVSNAGQADYSQIENLTENKKLSLIAEVFSTDPDVSNANKQAAIQSQVSVANKYNNEFLDSRGQAAISKEQFLARNIQQNNAKASANNAGGPNNEKRKLSEVLKDQIQGLAIAERKRMEEEKKNKEAEEMKKEGGKMMFRNEVYPNAEFYSNDEVLKKAKDFNQGNPLFEQIKERVIKDAIQQTLQTEEDRKLNTAESQRQRDNSNNYDPRTPNSAGEQSNANISQQYNNPYPYLDYSQNGSQRDMDSQRISQDPRNSQLPSANMNSQRINQNQYQQNPGYNPRNPRANGQIDEQEEEYDEYSQGPYSQDGYSQEQYSQGQYSQGPYNQQNGYEEGEDEEEEEEEEYEEESIRPPPKTDQKGFQRSNPGNQNKRK